MFFYFADLQIVYGLQSKPSMVQWGVTFSQFVWLVGWSRPATIRGGYKDGLQPESLADGNWLVKQNQLVSKIETESDTNLRSLYES